jgi:hypothetical protein
MCFDKQVSINTFILGIFALIMLKLNENTPYGMKGYKNEVYAYLFLLSIISMQLIEYMIWSNLDNKKLNTIFSMIALILIFSQPLFSLLSGNAGNKIIITYLAMIVAILLYKTLYNPIIFTTDVNGTHLRWNWLKLNGVEYTFLILWMLALFYGMYLRDIRINNKINILNHGFVILILIFSVYMYSKTDTWGSLWCFWINIISIYILFKIVFINTFMTYNKIVC